MRLLNLLDLLSDEGDPNQATDIGALNSVLLDVARIEHDGSEWVFAEDVPAVYLALPRSIQFETRFPPCDVWRMEVKVEKQGAPIRHGDSLVVNYLPFTNGLVQATKFKRRREARQPLLSDDLDCDQAVAWVENLKYDYWETNQKYLTAGILRIDKMVHAFTDTIKNPSIGMQIPYALFGACPGNVEDCVNQLFEHKRIQTLLAMTGKNRLYYYVKGGKKSGENEGYQRKSISLDEDTRMRAREIMSVAIKQALAGRAEFNREKTSVAAYAVERYLNLMNSISRKYARTTEKERTYGRHWFAEYKDDLNCSIGKLDFVEGVELGDGAEFGNFYLDDDGSDV